MKNRVSIAIFSQSAEVARGTADIVRDLVGKDVPCAYHGCRSSGGADELIACMKEVLMHLPTEAGIAVLVDIGATEAAAETAIDMLPPRIKHVIRLCDAPIVEGAIIVCTEALRGASLDEVCDRAHKLTKLSDTIAG